MGALIVSRDHEHSTCSALDGVAKSIRSHLDNLQHKQTGRDPKTNGYAYAEVPDWALRQWLDRIEIAQGRGQPIVGSDCAEPAEIEDLLQQQVIP